MKMKTRRFPREFRHMVSNTVKHYLDAPENVQKLVNMTHWIKGRWGKYILQTSHGTQQIKLYEPEKYKNEVNTPLRIRARSLFRMAQADPHPNFKDKLNELLRTYPFHLDKELPVNLRLRNFYFDKIIVAKELVSIYKLRGSPDATEPDTELDELYWEGEYGIKKTVLFEYCGAADEYYYGVYRKNGAKSNMLHFIWN